MNNIVDPWFLENLVCPVSKKPLVLSHGFFRADDGYEYPIVNGIPVMLRETWKETLWVAGKSLAVARQLLRTGKQDDWAVETLGISDEEAAALRLKIDSGVVQITDPVISYLVGATNGIAYEHLIGALNEYPIPEIRLPKGRGEVLLDVGCNWGRWSIAANRKGYSPIGLDPSLGAVMAARRIANQMGVSARYLVGDARYLPFKDSSIDVVFSYSVFQHFSYENVEVALKEIKKTLKINGYCFIQMPNKMGLRCLYHQFKRPTREPANFDVRYWSISQIKRTFSSLVGRTTLSVEGFFGLGIQISDLSLMPLINKIIIVLSYLLTGLSRVIRPLIFFADSVYVRGTKVAE